MKKLCYLLLLLIVPFCFSGCDWIVERADIFGKPDVYAKINNVLIDGKADDSVYGNLFKIASNVENRNSDEGFNVELISDDKEFELHAAAGESGLFCCFEAKDSVLNAKEEKEVEKTGLQLYIGGSSTTYELTASLTGEIKMRKYDIKTETYATFVPYFGIKSFIKLNGELNSTNAEGYSIEMFVPYSLLGFSSPQSVYKIAPAVIMHLDLDGEHYCWEWLGESEKGYRWADSNSFLKFGTNGLIA